MPVAVVADMARPVAIIALKPPDFPFPLLEAAPLELLLVFFF
jgi:hypothetical protein